MQSRHSARFLCLIPICFAFVSACTPKPIDVLVNGGTCPLPPSLSNEDSDKVRNFSAEVTGAVKYVSGVEAKADIQSKLKKEFPGASEVNKIYALSFAACTACRLNPGEVKACGELFKDLIDRTPRTEAARASAGRAEEYSRSIINTLIP